jgi:OOP family OmpA-OmpF porin
MGRTAIWLLGLFALALLVFLCVRNNTAEIQEDILNRTASALSAVPTKWAKVAVDGRNVTLTGIAPSEALREKAGERAGAVWGVVSVDNQLTVVQAIPEAVLKPEPVAVHNPYKTQFSKNASGIVLTGLVPDEWQHKDLLQLAEEKFGVGHVTDKLQINSDAPQGWQQLAVSAITNLALFDVGSASIVDTEFSVSGRVANDQTKKEVESALQKELPGNFNADIKLMVPKLAVEEIHQDTGLFCKEKFNKIITGHVIHFSIDSVGVRTEAETVFEKVLEFAASCPNSIVEVAGHTDSSGSKSYNLWLSRKRAVATMNKLIKKGMRADRVKAVGHGEANPLSGNDSRKWQAENRRIEFNYLQEGE